MTTTFSIQAKTRFDSVVPAWDAVRILAECIEHVTPDGRRYERAFTMLGDNKKWERDTLPELAVVRETHELAHFALLWNWALDGMQWSLRAHTYEDAVTEVAVHAYAGVNAIKTEEAMRTVLARASERGVTLKLGSLEYHADERETDAKDTVVLNKGPMRKWKIFRAWVGPHLVAYVTGTLTSLTSAALLVVLGMKG